MLFGDFGCPVFSGSNGFVSDFPLSCEGGNVSSPIYHPNGLNPFRHIENQHRAQETRAVENSECVEQLTWYCRKVCAQANSGSRTPHTARHHAQSKTRDELWSHPLTAKPARCQPWSTISLGTYRKCHKRCGGSQKTCPGEPDWWSYEHWNGATAIGTLGSRVPLFPHAFLEALFKPFQPRVNADVMEINFAHLHWGKIAKSILGSTQLPTAIVLPTFAAMQHSLRSVGIEAEQACAGTYQEVGARLLDTLYFVIQVQIGAASPYAKFVAYPNQPQPWIDWPDYLQERRPDAQTNFVETCVTRPGQPSPR